MAVRDINSTVARVVINDALALDGAQQIIKAGGKSISREELQAFMDTFGRPGLKVDAATAEYVNSSVDELQGLHRAKEQMNATAKQEEPGLAAAEIQRTKVGVATRSFGGTPISDVLKGVLNAARANGMTAYDVRQVEDPEWNEEHKGFELPGVWTPYPQEIEARGSMSFGYTEVTPEKIKTDMATVQKYKQINGYKEERINLPMAGSQPQVVQVPQYKDVEGKGTGNITQHYDTSNHREIYARGSSGQVWSNNYSLLSDGSLHCLPAMRRSEYTRHILTNPSLGRGQRMLGNGHIEMRGGVITSIGISGRLENRAKEGKMKLIDPLAVLRAQGFQIDPNCQVRLEGSNTIAKFDPVTHLLIIAP